MKHYSDYVVIGYRYGHRDGHSYLVDICTGIDTAKESAQKEFEDRSGKYTMVVFSKTKEDGRFIEEVYKIDCPEQYTNGTTSPEKLAEEFYPLPVENGFVKRVSFMDGYYYAMSTKAVKL